MTPKNITNPGLTLYFWRYFFISNMFEYITNNKLEDTIIRNIYLHAR